jgi:hypothetical protein
MVPQNHYRTHFHSEAGEQSASSCFNPHLKAGDKQVGWTLNASVPQQLIASNSDNILNALLNSLLHGSQLGKQQSSHANRVTQMDAGPRHMLCELFTVLQQATTCQVLGTSSTSRELGDQD